MPTASAGAMQCGACDEGWDSSWIVLQPKCSLQNDKFDAVKSNLHQQAISTNTKWLKNGCLKVRQLKTEFSVCITRPQKISSTQSVIFFIRCYRNWLVKSAKRFGNGLLISIFKKDIHVVQVVSQLGLQVLTLLDHASIEHRFCALTELLDLPFGEDPNWYDNLSSSQAIHAFVCPNIL